MNNKSVGLRPNITSITARASAKQRCSRQFCTSLDSNHTRRAWRHSRCPSAGGENRIQNVSVRAQSCLPLSCQQEITWDTLCGGRRHRNEMKACKCEPSAGDVHASETAPAVRQLKRQGDVGVGVYHLLGPVLQRRDTCSSITTAPHAHTHTEKNLFELLSAAI